VDTGVLYRFCSINGKNCVAFYDDEGFRVIATELNPVDFFTAQIAALPGDATQGFGYVGRAHGADVTAQ
jgi:hypothetical protein